MKRALDHFPFQELAERVWNRYFVPGGKAANRPYRNPPMQTKQGPPELQALCVVANFVEVFLAREGHTNPVGINFMEKLQPPHLASIYGAMLAGVDYILMGAGIPIKIPGVLDRYVNHEAATYPLNVAGATSEDDTLMHFDPSSCSNGAKLPPLKRPKFLAIIASSVLALTLTTRANGKVDGFIIEGPTAGGHNAPPRGQLKLNDRGEPLYGDRDRVDLAKLRAVGLPFWLAGGYGSAEQLEEALREGAAGIQVGSAFAFCEESGMAEDQKELVIRAVREGRADVFTDPLASPTGFPFKVAQVPGTISDPDVFNNRPRVCDLGYLREAYKSPDGQIGFRCSAEPVAAYVAKGGTVEEAEGRKCICNALLAAIGQPQLRTRGYTEPAVVTAGDDLSGIARFLPSGADSYSAGDVISVLLRSRAGD
jgi:nitronate monooxygenase